MFEGLKLELCPDCFFVRCSSRGRGCDKSVVFARCRTDGDCNLFDLGRSVRPRKDLRWDAWCVPWWMENTLQTTSILLKVMEAGGANGSCSNLHTGWWNLDRLSKGVRLSLTWAHEHQETHPISYHRLVSLLHFAAASLCHSKDAGFELFWRS